jgi:DNA-binding MarR family transcriptional regulator
MILVRTLDQKVTTLISQLARYSHVAPPGTTRLSSSHSIALQYFRDANRLSRTTSGFATFSAITVSTASTVVNSLVTKGYLVRERSKDDRRTVYLDVTTSGLERLRLGAIERLARLVRNLPEEDQTSLVRVLEDLVRAMAKELHRPGFGICGKCEYLSTSDPATCTLHGLELPAEELDLLCIYFLAANTVA